jgi:hypothetical protein
MERAMRHPTRLDVARRTDDVEEVVGTLELRDGRVVGEDEWMAFFDDLYTPLQYHDQVLLPGPEDGEAYLVACWAGLRGSYVLGGLVDAAGASLSREEGIRLIEWWGKRLASPDPEVAPGDSAEQRAAEEYLIEALGDRLGLPLHKAGRTLGGSVVEFDAISEDPPILVEAWAHQGRPKPAQKNKVIADALKMVWAASVMFPSSPVRKVLLLSDDVAAAHFLGKSWIASALNDLGVEVVVIRLPDELRQAVVAAQGRQGRSFAGRQAARKANPDS